MSNRSKEFIYYVYKTMITGSDKYYIGRRKCRTNDPMTDGYFGSGTWVKSIKDKSRLFKVVLAVFDNIADCKAEEQRLLDIHVGLPDNMNINIFADGGSVAGANNPGHKNAGITRSKETRAKISAKMSGENHPCYGKFGELNPMHGRTHTEEAKAKISIAFRGEKSHQAKLKNAEVTLIRELWATGDYTQTELAVKFGVKKTTISKIILRKTWKHI